MAGLLVCLAFFLLLLYVWYSYFYGPYQLFKKRGIPGPAPRYFFGSYKELASKKGGVAGLEAQKSLASKYGSICGYFIGYHPYLMVAEPDAIQEVLVRKFNNFRNRGATSRLLPFGRNPDTPTLITGHGDQWKRIRQLMTPSFSARKLKVMEPLMKQSVGRFMQRVSEVADTEKSVDVHNWMSKLVLEILLSTFFSRSADLQGSASSDGDKLCRHIISVFDASKTGGRVDIFKGRLVLSAFPFLTGFVGKMIRRSKVGQSMSKVVDVALQIVADRKTDQSTHKDMLQQIMEVEPKLSDDEVVAQVTSLMLSGNETTTNTLTFTCYLLALHPAVQDRLAEEITSYYRDHPDASIHDAATELVYLDMVVHEVLRLFPPFTKVSRVCEHDCEVAGYTVPVGVFIDIPIYYIHHNPEWWTEPEKFDPERFSPENSEGRLPFTYLPFSDGPRNCIGARFALMEIKVVLVELLKKYKVMRGPETEVPICTLIGVTLGPKDTVMLRFASRGSDV